MGFTVHGHNGNGLPMEPYFSDAISPEMAQAEAERAGMVVERVEAEVGARSVQTPKFRKARFRTRLNPFDLAHGLAWLFRVFAILAALWTVLELLAVVGGGVTIVGGRAVVPQGWLAVLWAALGILGLGLWLVALNLAIAEGLKLLLVVEARGRRPKTGDQQDDLGSVEQPEEPFW
jgi:hypothetical protein